MSRKVVLLLTLLVIALGLGCSSRARELVRAARLEKDHPEQAVQTYQRVLPQVADAQRRSQVLYRMGECLLRLDRITEAFAAFQKATEADPKNLSAKLRVGEFLLSAGATERAREQAESALAQSTGSNSEALALWGAALAASGEPGKAKDAYRRVLEMDPNRVSVAIALADLLNREGDAAGAKRVLQDAAARTPNSASPLLALARLHEQEGEVADAEKAYRQAVAAEDTPETNLRLAQFLQRTARIQEAEQVLRRVDAQRPGQPTALPDFELLAGRTTSALDSYEAAFSSKLDQSRGNKRPDSELVSQRARLATRLVEADLELAATKADAEKNAAIQRARAHLDQGRVDLDQATIAILEAEIALAAADLPRASLEAERAVALAPQSAPAHYVAGIIKAGQGNSAEARAHLEAALQADDHFVPARLALAEQALRSGDTKSAEENVVGVVRDEPGNLRALNLFARVLVMEKRYASAGLIARRAQAVDTSSPEPHLVLGRVALEQRQIAEALLQFEHAVLLNPHSKEAVEGLTDVYRTGKVTRPMLMKMEQVAANAPPSPTLMEIAGRLYAERGWYADAKRCLERALRMDPQRTTAASALARAFAATGDLRAAADSASHSGGNSAAMLAGVRAQERNDIKSAIDNYEKAVRQGDHSGVAANNLAWLYAQQGTNLERALALAESARQMAPDSPAVLDTVGVVQLRLRKYTEAIQALESAQRLAANKVADPQLLAQINQHLAEAYLRVGKTDAAEALVRR